MLPSYFTLSARAAFDDYGHFCATVWQTADSTFGDKDIVVMGYGLAGEWSEVAELLAEGPVVGVRALVVEELGDTSYYFARIAAAHGLGLGELASERFAEAFDAECEGDGGFLQLAVAALQMTAATGRVLEVMKKHVRDGRLDLELLERSLRSTIERWGAICRLCGIDWREVLTANEAKVRSRKALREAAGITTPA